MSESTLQHFAEDGNTAFTPDSQKQDGSSLSNTWKSQWNLPHCFDKAMPSAQFKSTGQILWTNREDRRCAGTLPCDTVSVVQIPGFRSLTRHGSSVLGSEPACHVLQIADSMRSAALGVCATELEAFIGDCTCNLRNSVAARWPFQIFSIKSNFNCQIY